MFSHRLLIVCMSAVVCVASLAKQCSLSIKGKVLDANTHRPLDMAVLELREAGMISYADAQGKFAFDSICPGSYLLACSHVGCATLVVSLQIFRDTTLRLELDHQEVDLQEVVVTQHKKENAATQVVEQLTGAQLQQLRGLSLGEILKEIPGVSVLKTGTNIAKPVIHGLHSNRVLMLNNGIRQEGQQWGSEHAPEIDPFLAAKITVIKGAASLRYGSDAIGGVVLVEPNPLPAQTGIHGEVNYVLHTNNFEHHLAGIVEGNHRKFSSLAWRVQGTYRRGGNVQSPGYVQKNTGIEEGNFSLALGYQKPNKGAEVFVSRFQTRIAILAAAHIGNLRDLQRAILSPMPYEQGVFSYNIGRPYQLVSHMLTKIRAYAKTGRKGEFSATLAWQMNDRKEYDKHVPRNDSLRPAFQFQLQTITTDLVWEHKPRHAFSGCVGANFMTQTNNYDYAYFIPGYWNFGGGVFVAERFTHGKWEFEGGLRLDYRWLQAFPVRLGQREIVTRNFIAPSGNVGLDCHINENAKWNFNVGTAWRAPAPNELFSFGLHHGAGAFEIGDRTLNTETAYNLTTSLEWRCKYVQLDVGLFQHFINGFIYLVPDTPATLTIRGIYPKFKFVQTKASLSGGDVQLVLLPVKGLQVRTKTSLLWAWNATLHDWLEQMPPIRTENGVNYTITNTKKQEFFAGANVLYVMRQYLVPRYDRDYAPPPPAYWLLHIETGMRMPMGKQNISAIFSIANATDNRYRDYLDRFRYYTDAQGLNAVLRLRYEF